MKLLVSASLLSLTGQAVDITCVCSVDGRATVSTPIACPTTSHRHYSGVLHEHLLNVSEAYCRFENSHIFGPVPTGFRPIPNLGVCKLRHQSMRFLRFVLIFVLFPERTICKWTRIKLPTRVWSSITIQPDGQRHLNCGNFDQNPDYKYHWRFNGSSILPSMTQIHKQDLIFLSASNAERHTLHGTYECCVHELLGKACYAQFVNVTDRPRQEGIDLLDKDVLNGKEGDTYYIRLFRQNKRIDAVHCIQIPDMIHVASNIKYPVFHSKFSKQSNPYHLRIEKFGKSNVHKYNCTMRFNKKEHTYRIFEAKFYTENSKSSCAFVLLISFHFVLILLTL